MALALRCEPGEKSGRIMLMKGTLRAGVSNVPSVLIGGGCGIGTDGGGAGGNGGAGVGVGGAVGVGGGVVGEKGGCTH